jgi:hypothetical protein
MVEARDEGSNDRCLAIGANAAHYKQRPRCRIREEQIPIGRGSDEPDLGPVAYRFVGVGQRKVLERELSRNAGCLPSPIGKGVGPGDLAAGSTKAATMSAVGAAFDAPPVTGECSPGECSRGVASSLRSRGWHSRALSF